MIEINQLDFAYRKGAPLFRQLNLRLESGKIYGLLGLNGAGKSTLLRLMNGLLFPKAGNIRVDKWRPADRSAAFLSQLFLVTEEQMEPRGKIQRFVRTYAPFYPNFSQVLFEELLQRFEVDARATFPSLSTGQRKKVWLSFAIASNCPILLLDEPTNALDIPSKATFRSLLADLINADRTIIISTHQVRDVRYLLDHLLILKDGQMLLDQSLTEILQQFHFGVSRQKPEAGTVYYTERVPGGYLHIGPPQEYEESLDVEIEALFNAIIQRPEILNFSTLKTRRHV